MISDRVAAGAAEGGQDRGASWRIRVRGHADVAWPEWYDGLRAIHDGPDTVLVGALPDQSALFGLLLHLRDLGLEIVGLEPAG